MPGRARAPPRRGAGRPGRRPAGFALDHHRLDLVGRCGGLCVDPTLPPRRLPPGRRCATLPEPGRDLLPPPSPPRSRGAHAAAPARLDGVGRPAVLHRLRDPGRALLLRRHRPPGPRAGHPHVASPFTLEDAADDAAALVARARRRTGDPRRLLDGRSRSRCSAGAVTPSWWPAWCWRRPRSSGGSRAGERLTWRGLGLLGVVLRALVVPARRCAWGCATSVKAQPALRPRCRGSRARSTATRSARIVAGRAGAGALRRPAVRGRRSTCRPALLLTTGRPSASGRAKQRALAAAIGAEVVELAGDHLEPVDRSRTSSPRATRRLVDAVARRAAPAAVPAQAPSDASSSCWLSVSIESPSRCSRSSRSSVVTTSAEGQADAGDLAGEELGVGLRAGGDASRSVSVWARSRTSWRFWASRISGAA